VNPAGATIAEVAEAAGRQTDSPRGALSGADSDKAEGRGRVYRLG